SGAIIAGQVREPSGAAAVNALVVLQSVALAGEQPEVLTDERGVYHFDNLPPGNYTITVVHAEADVAEVMHAPADARLRANYATNPERDAEVVVGMLIKRPMLDTTSASSS